MSTSHMAYGLGIAAVCWMAAVLSGCVDDLNGTSGQDASSPCVSGCGTFEAGAAPPAAWDAGQSVPGQTNTGVPQPQDAAVAGNPPGATGGNLPCAVQSLLEEHCGTCHGATPSFGAPMSLARLADLHAQSKTLPMSKVHEVVKARINATGPARMPPASSPALSADALAALNGWLQQGAPAGTETCSKPDGGAGGPIGQERIDTSGLECHRFLAHAEGNKNAKFKVGAAVDAYYAMAFKAPWDTLVYGMVVQPIIDNTKAIHHWLIYEEDGVDGSVVKTIGQHTAGELIQGWAPGGTALDFRKFGDVGFELPPTSYVLELHYNSSDPNAMDASGAEFCIKRTQPKNVAKMSWLGHDNWPVALDFEGPRTTWTGTCAPISQEPIHILFVTPHMHEAGRHMKSVINSPNGSRILHDGPFSFDYQISYERKEVLMPGETITTTCTFSEPKSFGQATSEEMCYLFTYAYPKGALADNGLIGAFQHGVGTCLGQ
jgi:mono/diheme cytochrome c family protein